MARCFCLGTSGFIYFEGCTARTVCEDSTTIDEICKRLRTPTIDVASHSGTDTRSRGNKQIRGSRTLTGESTRLQNNDKKKKRNKDVSKEEQLFNLSKAISNQSVKGSALQHRNESTPMPKTSKAQSNELQERQCSAEEAGQEP